MKLKVPSHAVHRRVRFEISTPVKTTFANCGADLDEIEVRLPEGVEARDVGVVAQFLDSASNPVGEPVVVQEPADAPAEKSEPPVETSTEKLEPPAAEPTEKPLAEEPAAEPSIEESTEESVYEPPAEEPNPGRGRRRGTRSKQ